MILSTEQMRAFEAMLTACAIPFKPRDPGPGLAVLGEVRDTCTLALPDDLLIQGNLDLAHTQVRNLPDRLTVHKGVYLHHTPITVLPEGLHVGGRLDIRHTRITRLPRDMHVGSMIVPGGHLIDVQTFMAGQPDVVKIVPPHTQHQRLQVMDELRTTPDMCRIVMALQPGYHLLLRRTREGAIQSELNGNTS